LVETVNGWKLKGGGGCRGGSAKRKRGAYHLAKKKTELEGGSSVDQKWTASRGVEGLCVNLVDGVSGPEKKHQEIDWKTPEL